MAYRQHYLLQYGGTLYGNEIWSNGLRLARPIEAGSEDASQDWIDDMIADLRVFYGGPQINQNAVMTWVKLNRINELGKYASATTTTERVLAGTTGPLAVIKGGSTNGAPVPQVSLAITLHTDRSRGPGSKGRIYLPLPALATGGVGTDGRLSLTQVGAASALMLAFQTLITSLNNVPGLDVDAPRVVVATKGGKNMPEGDNVPVTGVSCGRVFDTVRRRRNSLLEDAQILPL